VIADTNVWSLYLRRTAPNRDDQRHVRALREAIASGRVIVLGPIRQELLSGMNDRAQFVAAREQLRAVSDTELATFDFERAAEFSNSCRTGGIVGSPVDMLICAVAERLNFPIFTLDRDFERYRDILGIALYDPA
jgi:predicted nucleic acid-binding protein